MALITKHKAIKNINRTEYQDVKKAADQAALRQDLNTRGKEVWRRYLN